MLKELFGSVHFYLVGGFTAPDNVASLFFKLAYELGISSSVTWLDRLEKKQLAKLYRRCAASGGAMLVTSRDESFGMAAAEALLCGCPLITNDLPVFREVFPESPMLQRVDIWQPEQVASAARYLSQGITEEHKLGMYETLKARYGAPAFLSALTKVIKRA